MELAIGQHHTVARGADGSVYAVGRGSEGQLGLPRVSFAQPDGSTKEEVNIPLIVPSLQGKLVTAVAVGSACSFSVLADGMAYAWGFAENLQLTTGEDEV